MARSVNTSFTGVAVSDVDPSALTRRRMMQEAIQDTALVHDLITGENSPPATLSHSGPGTGCVLGIPLMNQLMGAPGWDFRPDDNESTIAIGFMAPQPPGETDIHGVVQMAESRFGSMYLRVYNSSMTLVDSAEFEISNDSATERRATVTGLTGGTSYVYAVVMANWITEVSAVSLGWWRKASTTRPLISRLGSDINDTTELQTKTSSSATVIDFHDFDTAEHQDDQALSGYHTTLLALNQHGLAEMLTGAPAGTNSSRTLVDSASQGAFYDHDRLGSEWASMPLLAQLPLFAVGFGAVPEDGGTGGDTVGGFTNTHNAPGWATATTSATYRDLAAQDFAAPYGATNKLRSFVLATSPAATLGSMTAGVQVTIRNASSGASLDTSTAGFVQLGSSNFYVADVTSLDNAGATFCRAELGVAISAGAPKNDGSDLRIVGWSLWLED